MSAQQRIRELAADLAPVRPLPRLRTLTALAAATWLAAVLLEWWLGGPPPRAVDSWSPLFLGVLLGVVGLAGGGVAAALASAVPGRDAALRAGCAAALAGGALLAGSGALALAGPGHAAGAGFALPWLCIGRAAWLGLLPALALLGFAARGRALRPGRTAAAAWLGGLALGAVTVQLSCRDPGALHVLLGHAGGPVLLALALAAPAALWLRRRSAAG